MGAESADKLRKAVNAALPKDWRTTAPIGYPNQIELALIASSFRGADEEDVAFQVTSRFMKARPGKRLDDLSELGMMVTAAIAAAVGEPFDTARVVGGGRLRVDLAGDIAASLAAVRIRTAADFREAALSRPIDLERTVTEVKHSGPTTFLQLATLLRADTRPGSGVADWVREQVGDPSMSRADVHRTLQEAARKAGSEPFVLHFAIAQYVQATSGPVDDRARKAPARKAPAKKAPAKKAPAKKSAATAKKPVARKATAAKKPAPAKKPATRKATPKKKPPSGA